MSRTIAFILIAAAMLLAPAASEGAVTVGSILTPDASANRCSAGVACTYVQQGAVPASAAEGGLTSPIDGVIVRWRLKAGSAGGTVSLRVLAPTASGGFTGAGTSSAEVVTALQPAVNVYNARLPIAIGHRIGLNNASEGIYFAPNIFAALGYFTPHLPDGATGATLPSGQYLLLMNADIEPDVDRDGFGDDTQDGCPTNATTQGACRPPAPEPQPGLKAGACSNERRGGATGERLNGTPAGDRLFGLAGNDTLNGLQGDDCLFGGAGADRLLGGTGSDRLQGESQNDALAGGPGSDRLLGGSGKDTLKGDSGNDTLLGGSGNDRLTGGGGRNGLSAGGGRDTVNARNRRSERVDCGPGRDRAAVDRSDRIRRCERIKRR